MAYKTEFQNYVSLPHLLTTVTRLEAKRSNAWPQFHAITTNSPVGLLLLLLLLFTGNKKRPKPVKFLIQRYAVTMYYKNLLKHLRLVK